MASRQRIPRGQPGAGRYAPILTDVSNAAALVQSGQLTARYASRVVSRATRAGITELSPETRRIARGHAVSTKQRAQQMAELAAENAYQLGDTAGPTTRRILGRQLLQDQKYNALWDFVTKPSTPRQQRYYTPSDSPFGRMAYYSKGAMARYLRTHMQYDESEIDYILYPDEES